MTEDYKKILLDYITELQPEEAQNVETIKENIEVSRNKWINFIPDWDVFQLEGLIKSRTSDKIILYGGYLKYGGTYENDSRGIIIVTDSYLNPIQTIYNFSSDTPLRPIQKMIQEEDGQFVAIDSTILYPGANSSIRQQLMSNQKRVIMLNDISQKKDDKYEANLRRSYILGNDYRNFICKDIFKNPNTSHYVFTGCRILNNASYSPDGLKIISLKVNVGSANEWWYLNSDNNYVYGGGYVYFDNNDDANWKFLITKNNINDNKILLWGGKNTTVSQFTAIQSEAYRVYIDSNSFFNQVAFINETKAYYVQNNQKWGISGSPDAKYIGLYEVNLTNNKVTEIFSKSLGNYDYCDLTSILLQTLNGELYVQYCDNVSNNKANYYVQRFKGIWNPTLIQENVGYTGTRRMFFVSQAFNLLKMHLIPSDTRPGFWYMGQLTEIYNIANYNGYSYKNYNSLIAKYGNIYSDNMIVFSRNLHNLSITNNYTVASIEVPNTYLNDITFDIKELVSETNSTLVNNSNPVSKNIYEVLYINYINTIVVKDNNAEIQSNTSKYINANINVGTEANFNNTKCGKVEIVYQDNSNKIFPIGWDVINDTQKSTEFTIYVDKPIARINLISNDQTTTYITIQQQLEEGKYYKFKQYLKVE